MIQSFKHKGLSDLFQKGNGRKVQPKHAKRRNLILTALNAATHSGQMNMPGTRKHVSAIVNGRAPVTPDMAVRLADAFGTEPEIWVNLQAQYDLWLVRQQVRPKVKQLHTTA